jgi:hypothetical protein
MELKPKLFKLLLLNRNQKFLCTSQEPPNTGNTHMPRKQSTVYTWPYIHLRLQIRHKLTSSDRPIIRLQTHCMCQMPNGIEIIDDSQKCIIDLMSDPKVFPNAVIHHQTTLTNIPTPSHHHQAYCKFFKQYNSSPPNPNTSLLKCHQFKSLKFSYHLLFLLAQMDKSSAERYQYNVLSPLSPTEEPIQGPFTFITNEGTNIRKDVETTLSPRLVIQNCCTSRTSELP